MCDLFPSDYNQVLDTNPSSIIQSAFNEWWKTLMHYSSQVVVSLDNPVPIREGSIIKGSNGNVRVTNLQGTINDNLRRYYNIILNQAHNRPSLQTLVSKMIGVSQDLSCNNHAEFGAFAMRNHGYGPEHYPKIIDCIKQFKLCMSEMEQ